MVDSVLDNRLYVTEADLVGLRHQARGFSFLPRRASKNLLVGRRRSVMRGRGLDFIEMRNYQPGDDIRTMDWRATIRTGKPHVRVYAEEKDRPVLMVVDQRLSMFFGSQWLMKSVAAAHLAALAAWRVVDVGDRIGAVLFNDNEICQFRPARSQSRAMQILAAIVEMNQKLSASGQVGNSVVHFHDALEEVERLVSHDYLVVIISDFDGWNDMALKAVKRITRRNDVIAGLVYDPLEKDISSASGLVVSDGRYQLQINPDKDNLALRNRELFEGAFQEIRRELQKNNIPLLPVLTSEDVVLQLRRALGGGK